MPVRYSISADRIAALILVVIFTAYGLYGSSYESSLGVDVVGPDFFPTAVGILGVVLSALLLLRRAPAEEDPGPTQSRLEVGVVVTLGLMLVYVFTLEFLGFPIATLAFLVLSARYLGCPSWLGAVVFGIVGTLLAVLLFHYGLAVRLPQGSLIRLW